MHSGTLSSSPQGKTGTTEQPSRKSIKCIADRMDKLKHRPTEGVRWMGRGHTGNRKILMRSTKDKTPHNEVNPAEQSPNLHRVAAD
jgi:hypothetical protein